MVLISVVIISRNEEQNIAKCIESVLTAVEGIDDHEVILVDSVSTDRTVEIAKKYPITIIQLRPEWFLSASAGRYIGFLYSKGRYIQFQDGDSVLNKDWFRHAVPFLEATKKAAGVVGFITQEEYDNIVAKKWTDYSKRQKIGEIEYYEQDVLLRREVLEEIGAFNPYLRAVEEGELSIRIRTNNYKLFRIPNNMSHHLGGCDETFWSMLKRKFLFTKAYGQVLRYSRNDNRLFHTWLREYRFIVLFSFLMIYGFIAILLYIFNIHAAILIWAVGMVLFFIYVLNEMKSISNTVTHLLSLSIRWFFFVEGYLASPRRISEYPDDAIIIQKS